MFVQIKTGSPSRGRSQERGKGDKICHKFQKDQCDKGKKCPYKHVVKDDKARTQSPRRNNTRSSSKGNKGDRGKKLSKEEMAKTPCIYHAQGTCNRGDKCYYQHDDKAAAANKDAPNRINSPAPEEDQKGEGVKCRTMPGRKMPKVCMHRHDRNFELSQRCASHLVKRAVELIASARQKHGAS